MKMTVDTMDTEFRFGNVREVRGNFIEHITENGISYECDYYRTYGSETFEELHQKAEAEKAQKSLNKTDWVEVQLNRYALVYGIDSEEYKEKLDSRKALLAQRMEWEEIVRGDLEARVLALESL
jgi:hypothetical protein